MGIKGLRKFCRKIFTKVHARDADLRRAYEEAYENDKNFLTELGKFLESYEQCLIQIKGGGIGDGYMRIFEELKLVKGPLDRDYNQRFADQILLEKSKTLFTQREEFLKVLSGQIGKPRKKNDLTTLACRRCLRVVTHILFFGAAAAEIACTVVAAVMAAPVIALVIAAAIIPTLAGQHWTLSWIGEYETPHYYDDDVIREMKERIVDSMDMLGEIEAPLISVDIASLISDLNCVIEGDENFDSESIESLLEKIDGLKETARDYMSEISNARDVI